MANRSKNSGKLKNDCKWFKMAADSRYPFVDGHIVLAASSNYSAQSEARKTLFRKKSWRS